MGPSPEVPRVAMSDTIVLPQSPVAGPKPGDVVAGKYRLERELGRGAMGTVWSALHMTLGQRVAIKLIASEQSRSAEARQRFGVEAKAAARLRSRHVVQVYDDGETPDGTPYIVMEYLEGRTLEERLAGRPEMSLGEAVRITTHVGRALARAHAQSVVHRDLKSGNIFIAKSEDDELGWVAKVLDFGVAKVLAAANGSSATKTGTLVGTPLFMSPEQIRGASQVDHRADLYSLGMVFYNMVTGSHAFHGPSYSDVLVAICTEALPDIRAAAPWLPPALGAWFDKACAREREARFQSADEMIEALQDAAGPASRLTRPSVPDEVGGPSGTLVGHVPPDAAATLLADASGVRSVPAASRAVVASAGELTPASAAASERALTFADAVARRSSPSRADHNAKSRIPLATLSLWAASGAGLAVLMAGVVFVIVRVTSRDARAPLAAELATAPALQAPRSSPAPAPLEPVAAPSTTAAPPVAAPDSHPNAAVTAPPSVAPAPVAPSLPSPSGPADAHAVFPRRAPSLVRRASPGAGVGNAPAATSTPRATSTTPDMGF